MTLYQGVAFSANARGRLQLRAVRALTADPLHHLIDHYAFMPSDRFLVRA